jgi:hypothetical protein
VQLRAPDPPDRAARLVVHAEDDPFIPADPFRRVDFPTRLALELIPGGGHLGYISRARYHGDRRWLDARLVAWLASRWALNIRSPVDVLNARATPRNPQGGLQAHAQSEVQ